MINMENLIVDDIGVRPPPLCKSCSGCVNCNNMRLELSRDDQELLKLVKDNMEIDEENHTITAHSGPERIQHKKNVSRNLSMVSYQSGYADF